MLKRVLPRLKKLLSFFKKDLKVLLPQLYLIGILIGFIVLLLYAAFPNLFVCTALLGQEVCFPTGIFIGMVISLPGYIIAGNIMTKLPTLPAAISFLIVVIVSILFYYLVGLFFDKFKKAAYEERIRLIVLAIFILLLTMIVVLI